MGALALTRLNRRRPSHMTRRIVTASLALIVPMFIGVPAPIAATSATIEATVTYEETGRPAEFVEVFLQRKGREALSAYTDADGKVRFVAVDISIPVKSSACGSSTPSTTPRT